MAIFFRVYLCCVSLVRFACPYVMRLYLRCKGNFESLQVPEYATSLFSRLSWPFSNNSYQRLPIATTDENIPDHQARQMQASICNRLIFGERLANHSMYTLKQYSIFLKKKKCPFEHSFLLVFYS